jgi:FKBP-type peptidyl-prolyl cis-trans isomerase
MIMSVRSSASAEASTTTTTAATDAFTGYQPGQSKLAYKDEMVGQGESAQNGDTLKVSFVGRVYPSGAQFAKNDDFVFELGEGKTMPGFDVALGGSQAGTRRMIRVPPTLAFGKQGMPVRGGLLVLGFTPTKVLFAAARTLYCHAPLFRPLSSRIVYSLFSRHSFLVGSPVFLPMPIWSSTWKSRKLHGTSYRAELPSLAPVVWRVLLPVSPYWLLRRCSVD